MEKEIYQQPTAELIKISHPLTLLIDFSANGQIEDWEEGGEG
ncbi:hypothetical protein [Porphyromonas catoniae]|jgi:hypothetical protein|nr:hypothetical protein [Porphyromonas catoniae]